MAGYPLAGGGGTLGFIKTGGGTLLLSGYNTYSGPTLISNGTLRLYNGVAGFGGSGSGWNLNDSTGGYPVTVSGDVLTLTTSNNSEANAMWFDRPLAVVGGPWTAKFTYTNLSSNGADGGAFVLQTNGPGALGNNGGAKGLNGANGSYAPLSHSAAIVWNIYSGNGGSEVNCLTGGNASPTTATGNGVNLDATTPVNFTLSCDGTSALYLTAIQGSNSWTQTYSVALGSALNNPANGLAYVGFVGGTGGVNAEQQISNFSFSSNFGNILPAASAVQMAAGRPLDINGQYQTVGSLSGAGTLTNSNASLAATLVVGGDNTSQTFAGVLASAVPANLALIKIGSGAQTLSGADTYIGPTTVQGGTLRLRAAVAVRGAVAVTAGTLDISGFAQTIQSLSMSAGGGLDLSVGNLLTSTGAAALAGALDVVNVGAPASGSGSAELMAYNSESGTFGKVFGVPPAGYKLTYTPTQLDLVQTIAPTTYNLSASAAAGILHVGGSTTVTATITNAGTGIADALDYAGLNFAASAGSLGGAGMLKNGGPLAQSASDSGSLSYVASVPGTITLTPTASGTNATIGGAAAIGTTGSATISVFCGNGAWCGSSGSLWCNSGNWTDAEGVQAAPGTFAAFANCDTATFSGSGSVTSICLSGANPSLAAT